jgi:hypothetical protein
MAIAKTESKGEKEGAVKTKTTIIHLGWRQPPLGQDKTKEPSRSRLVLVIPDPSFLTHRNLLFS